MANYLTPWRRGSLASGGYGSDYGGGSLFDLHRQMNRLFNDLFDRGSESGSLAGAGIMAPALDVRQTDGKFEITAELPGVKEDDIDLTIEDGVLTLRGEKRSSRSDEQSGYSERSYGTFERRITLPSNVDEDKCSADFKDGVLTVTLPTSEEKARGRRIPLGRGSQTGKPANLNEPNPAEHQQAASEEKPEGEHQPS
ncbi:MAG: Hsp20/alpha crystallin family protein [Porphyrobacter sp.]|nr:Hsp20/alpha crystallin family protein [Porphyrobacter sp.]